MRTNIDFELAYEQLRSRVIRTINCKYFPKNILLKIWNNPYFSLPRDCIIVWATLPKIAVISITNMLDAIQQIALMSHKELGRFFWFFVAMIGATALCFLAMYIGALKLAPKLIASFPKLQPKDSVNLAFFLIMALSLMLINLRNWLKKKRDSEKNKN